MLTNRQFLALGTMWWSVLVVVVLVAASCGRTSARAQLEQAVAQANKSCPVDYGMGKVTGYACSDSMVNVNFEVDESVMTVDKLKANSDLVKRSVLMELCETEAVGAKQLVALVVSSGCGIRLNYHGATSGQTAIVNISTGEIEAVQRQSGSPDELLAMEVQVTKLMLPVGIDEVTDLVDLKIAGGSVVYIYNVDESEMPMEDVAKNANALRMNLDNTIKSQFEGEPTSTRRFLANACSAGKSVRHSYRGSSSGKVVDVEVTNRELRELIGR